MTFETCSCEHWQVCPECNPERHAAVQEIKMRPEREVLMRETYIKDLIYITRLPIMFGGDVTEADKTVWLRCVDEIERLK